MAPPDPKIKKLRSLTSRDDSWGWGSRDVDPKHFRVNGAVPDNAPSNGSRHRKNKDICKRAPDHIHHYEVRVNQAYRDFEQMVDTCIHCGKKLGYGFRVWVRPKPEWYIRMQARWKR